LQLLKTLKGTKNSLPVVAVVPVVVQIGRLDIPDAHMLLLTSTLQKN
jgi:hypothetical protein